MMHQSVKEHEEYDACSTDEVQHGEQKKITKVAVNKYLMYVCMYV